MIKGFVFGKFLPFHKGHEAMINFALTKCDRLTVLVCCSDKETIPAEIRQNWISQTFASTKNINVEIFNYKEDELPNTSVSSTEVSQVWSEKFKTLFPDYNLVITSEKYGDYVASFMGIQHIPFNVPRDIVPISASMVRGNLIKYWNYLPESVKPYFAIKVVILGTESTGKTTLTEKLAIEFGCSSVAEVGRELIPDSQSFDYDDLYLIASEHANKIDNAHLENSPLLIIDTDIHTTKSYANFVFGKPLNVDENIYNSNKADLYLYLNNDVKFIQDGTRLNENERNLLDLSHRQILKEHNIAFTEINGDWETRFENAVQAIKQLLGSKYPQP